MLGANEITPLKKCINITYDKTEEVYEIPNYCKNEPVYYYYRGMHCKNKLPYSIHSCPTVHLRERVLTIPFFAKSCPHQIWLKTN